MTPKQPKKSTPKSKIHALEADGATSENAKDEWVKVDPRLLIPSVKDSDLLSSLGDMFNDCGYKSRFIYHESCF